MKASQFDDVLIVLRDLVKEGFSDNNKRLDECVKPFWNVRKSLSVSGDGVVLYDDRVIVPKSLQVCVLEILHFAHQGTSIMDLRAQSIVFWPGITSDIKQIRDECSLCCKNAPSQPKLPASSPEIPSTFESIFADFFDVSNHHYLVDGDRLPCWVQVFSTQTA